MGNKIRSINKVRKVSKIWENATYFILLLGYTFVAAPVIILKNMNLVEKFFLLLDTHLKNEKISRFLFGVIVFLIPNFILHILHTKVFEKLKLNGFTYLHE